MPILSSVIEGFAGAMLYGIPLAAFLCLQIGWARGSVAVATERLGRSPIRTAANVVAIASAVSASILAPIMGFILYAPEAAPSIPTPVMAVLMICVSGGSLVLNLLAAKALCDAERAATTGAPHVLGTFIQFVYLMFAVPFLYRRLVAIRQP